MGIIELLEIIAGVVAVSVLILLFLDGFGDDEPHDYTDGWQ